MELLAPPSDKDLNLSLLIYLKETVSVISNDNPYKDSICPIYNGTLARFA